MANRKHPYLRFGIVFYAILALSSTLFGQDSVAQATPFTIKSVPPKWPLLINPLIPPPDTKPSPNRNQPVEKLVNGYRIQVLATRSSTKADELKASLIEKTSLPVYISFESPNYKVRVGNYLTRKEADKARKTLRSLGYRTAWVVQSRVIVREP